MKRCPNLFEHLGILLEGSKLWQRLRVSWSVDPAQRVAKHAPAVAQRVHPDTVDELDIVAAGD